MACAGLFDEETCKRIPNCSYRKYTVSGAINSMIGSGFILKKGLISIRHGRMLTFRENLLRQ